MREYAFYTFAGLELFIGRDLCVDAIYPKFSLIREPDGYTARVGRFVVVVSKAQGR